MLSNETRKSGVTGDETDEDSGGLKKAKLVESFRTAKTRSGPKIARSAPLMAI